MKQCNICKEDTPTLESKIEASVMDMIKRNNPNWVESDGACTKCTIYYKKISGSVKVDNKKP